MTDQYRQSGFRGRIDDGGEADASWIDEINTNWLIRAGIPFRVRFHVQEINGGSRSNINFGLRFRVSGGEWIVVTDSSVARFVASPNVTGGTPTTQQISTEVDPYTLETADNVTTNIDEPGLKSFDDDFWLGTEFVPGVIDSDGSNSITLDAYQETEIEYVIDIDRTKVSSDDVIEFQVIADGQPLDEYAQVPLLDINALFQGVLEVEVGQYETQGHPVTLTANRLVRAESGVYTNNGHDAALIAARMLHPVTGEYLLNGNVTRLRKHVIFRLPSGEYLLTPSENRLIRDARIFAPTGIYRTTGRIRRILYSGWTPVAAGAEVWSPIPANDSGWTPVAAKTNQYDKVSRP